jgi:hypothetical protein
MSWFTPEGLPEGADFAFTVEVKGAAWDVYYFTKDGKPGTLAFRQVGDQFEVGIFKGGRLTSKEAVAELEKPQGD